MVRVEVSNKGAKDSTYPRLMFNVKQVDEIVFMTKSGQGVVLTGPRAGKFAGFTEIDEWDMDFFYKFNGSITMENAE